MNEMKTLTVNGITYAVTDPNAPRIDDTAVGDAPWSAKKIVDTLCPGFTKSGSIVTCHPVAGYPLEVAAAAAVTRCGKNLFDFTAMPYPVTYVGSSGSSYDRIGFAVYLPAGTYTLHAEACTPNQGEDFLYGTVMNADGTYQEACALRAGLSDYTRTVTLDTGDYILLYDGTGGSLKQAQELFGRFHVQVEVGSKASAFAPYCGEVFAAGEEIPALAGVNTVFAENGQVTVTGRADPAYLITSMGGVADGL